MRGNISGDPDNSSALDNQESDTANNASTPEPILPDDRSDIDDYLSTRENSVVAEDTQEDIEETADEAVELELTLLEEPAPRTRPPALRREDRRIFSPQGFPAGPVNQRELTDPETASDLISMSTGFAQEEAEVANFRQRRNALLPPPEEWARYRGGYADGNSATNYNFLTNIDDAFNRNRDLPFTQTRPEDSRRQIRRLPQLGEVPPYGRQNFVDERHPNALLQRGETRHSVDEIVNALGPVNAMQLMQEITHDAQRQYESSQSESPESNMNNRNGDDNDRSPSPSVEQPSSEIYNRDEPIR